jgi:MoaA/NifB/PqqE/SkfB family radical SAM enzyme
MDFLTLFISLRCTQSCHHCLYGCSPDCGEHMSRGTFTQSLSIARKNQISKLNFFGGEPLLNPDFFSMLQTALENKYTVMLATNCRLLADAGFLKRFLRVTEQYKEKIVIITARDKFHLQFFDPAEVIGRLLGEGYKLIVNDYSDQTVLLTEHNINHPELSELNTDFSCCDSRPSDSVGVLPEGGWTICPVSLETFGDIFSESLEEILEFKRQLPLKYKDGCTGCLKDFSEFHNLFEAKRAAKQFRG